MQNRHFSEIQKNARCPLCRLIYTGLLQNRPLSNQLDNERIYYYRLLFGTFDITEIDEFDPDHEYDDLELYDLNELNLKRRVAGKEENSDSGDIESTQLLSISKNWL